MLGAKGAEHATKNLIRIFEAKIEATISRVCVDATSGNQQ